MFKKRAQTKKLDLVQDAQQIIIEETTVKNEDQQTNNTKSRFNGKKVNVFSMKDNKKQQPVKIEKSEYDKKAEMGLVPKHNVQYGLIEKDKTQKVKVQNNAVMDMYVKEKIKEFKKKQQPVKPSIKMNMATQIFQMQRKYLQPTGQKIASYDVGQIQRKLQIMSTQLIKSQQQKRTQYLKNLLQNQLQRLQYASKKQLKMIRQQKQRDQKYLQASYQKQGRRHQINIVKNQAFKDFVSGKH